VSQEKHAPVAVLDGGLLAVPGLEALREIHAGRAPQPPIHDWSGRRLVGLCYGSSVTLFSRGLSVWC